ncbi:transcription antitermination factor NusB [Cytobacillus gottheilii]|uniref:Transcription antitermination protein NusB n=1 Tax=Cytobacillus gottheilii TaxID=859144 RepID=A0ABX8FA04_9BACI|nr:transcription antitermination factor NusB [Cytobacillus gottheilii]QVY60296.1 transcription antitermination factor NusB [Cytobacillus gottheilii]
MKRRTAREKALQALFQIDVSETDINEAIEHVLDGAPHDQYLTMVVEGVIKHRDEIDQLIQKHLEKWTIERLATVDRNILRIAIFEFKYTEEAVPVNVVLDEAIEVAKLFGDDKSPKFINGVLSKVKADMQ